MEPIDLRMASVREARSAERRFCFEVITPQYKRVYQAPSEEDLHAWINALNNALQNAVEGRSHVPQFSPTSTPAQSTHRDIGSILTGKSSSYSGHHHQSPSNTSAANSVYRHRTVGARPIYLRSNSNGFDEDPSRLLTIIRDNDQGNRWCADCDSDVKVEWVSINLGIVLCIECSGIHRSLGTHISKIRSLTLDTQSFTTDIVECLLQIGNRISNMVWEAQMTSENSIKPPAQSATRDQRLRFITAKYVDRVYVTPITRANLQSHYATPDETLLASVKKNDIQSVLYALANHANPNSTDLSRNTPAVFLALAAADPAAPGGISTTSRVSPMPSPSSTKTLTSPNKETKAFPVAELLVQNGGVIPTSLPAFPLSQNACLYIDQKTGKSGIGGADTLGPLPNMNRRSGMGTDGPSLEVRDVGGEGRFGGGGMNNSGFGNSSMAAAGESRLGSSHGLGGGSLGSSGAGGSQKLQKKSGPMAAMGSKFGVK